ncbi:MAG: hypothetical protein HRU19_10925 [Pseudobacteriovorax sp.]|nr:hypothetical protein [Pseudobacteriovorax sp.]
MIKNIKNFHSANRIVGKDYGAVAIEYVLVSIFGLLAAIAAITFVTQAIETKFSSIEEELGIEFDTDSLNPFS